MFTLASRAHLPNNYAPSMTSAADMMANSGPQHDQPHGGRARRPDLGIEGSGGRSRSTAPERNPLRPPGLPQPPSTEQTLREAATALSQLALHFNQSTSTDLARYKDPFSLLSDLDPGVRTFCKDWHKNYVSALRDLQQHGTLPTSMLKSVQTGTS